jgi:hypothetical protein
MCGLACIPSMTSPPKTRESGRGSLSSCITIYPEVVERHHHSAYYEAAPQSHIPTAMDIICACLQNIVRFGGGKSLGRILGDGTKKRPLSTLCYMS